MAIATHGRAFWVLDNLSLLEQVAAGHACESACVFAPQTAWLTHVYGGGNFPRPEVGTNPAFGATVFFHVPETYNGTQPVTLTFTDANNNVVHAFTLHPKSKHKVTPAMREQMKPAQLRALAEEEATAITPGSNTFQWDLRYPYATDVNGFYVPVAAGGEEDTIQGPEAVPGTYHVTLDYAGTKTQQSFTVALDPNLHPSEGGLAARFALLMRIHNTLDTMDTLVNRALAMHNRSAALNRAIDNLVNLKTQSSEGPLLSGTRVRDHLAYLISDVEFAYDKPTAAQYAVYDQLRSDAASGESRLRALMH